LHASQMKELLNLSYMDIKLEMFNL
jgi:hypothetical protein